MNDNIILSASILSANFATLEEQIRTTESSGVDWIHIDVMDGHFVPNITMGPFIVETCRKITTLPLDVHLMIEKPENHISAFAKAGANIITVHIEGNANIHRTLQEIHTVGCKAGIAINPGTPVSSIAAVLPYVDLVLLMTVNPGFSGQSFITGMTNKVSAVAQLIQELDSPIYLQVDGGITKDTLPLVYKAGANTFVAATSIFRFSSGITEGIKALRHCVL